jgi:predicted acyl esterase
MTVSWSHFHMHGVFEAFRRIRTPRKWLRAHREFEWPDAYSHCNLEDLRIFFDRYLKNINNGWELTPRVRLDVMDAYDYDYQLHRAELEFPLERTQYTRYYLDAENMTMGLQPFEKEAKVSYDAKEGVVCFDMAFDEETELTGYMKLHLWVEAEGNDEMDLFINIQKADENGKWLPTLTLDEPHPGQWGKQRVSRRALDETRSTDYHPVLLQQYEEKLKPGEIVPVEISIWPSCKIWHKGQKLRVQIAGHYIREGWFEPLRWETDNVGRHVIHTGGQYDSYLLAPVIPARYTAKGYTYR